MSIEPLVFNLLQTKYALSIEVSTGLRNSRGSVLKMAKQRFGVLRNTKKGALEEIEIMLQGVAYARGEDVKVPRAQWKYDAFERGFKLVSEGKRTMSVYIQPDLGEL
jgi:hypothetical protein